MEILCIWSGESCDSVYQYFYLFLDYKKNWTLVLPFDKTKLYSYLHLIKRIWHKPCNATYCTTCRTEAPPSFQFGGWTHWDRDKMAAILQTTFFNTFSWMRISIKMSLKFVPKGPVKDIPTLIQIMAWRGPGDKPLSEPMMVSLLTHISHSASLLTIFKHWLR